MNPSEQRAKLEQSIAATKLDLYIVPMVDEFQGEYIPEYAARLPYLTGFTGSAGLGVFSAKHLDLKHALFVDGRYTLQAAAQVDGDSVHMLNSGDTSFLDWLNGQAQKLTIGFDPWLVTEAQREGWQKATIARGTKWVAHSPNLVDGIWEGQPVPPSGEVQLQPLELTGASYAQKRAALVETLKKQGAESALLTQPDGINWLLNIRGADVPFNPLLLAHMLVKVDGSATLFVTLHEFSVEVTEYLKAEKVTVAPLADVFAGNIRKDVLGASVLVDASATAAGWFTLIEKLGAKVMRGEDPTTLPKASKNAVELSGIRAAHARDGLALSRFLHWFDEQNMRGRYPDELAVVEKLEEFRKEDASYRGPSFATISGSGPNGAIVHYRADAASNRKMRSGEIFLLDSGAQYPDGTTDVTRTLFVSSPAGGVPAPAMTEHFTRVLKGHIALASVRFPIGTNGGQLDVLARQYLWEVGLDYDHGTGHGVGAFLCVHEGPQRISKRGSAVALTPGMILSNEPGYYAAGQYGIRIENLVVVVDVGKSADAKQILAFETLTLAPIDTRLVNVAMLSIAERNWLNAYHRRVYDTHEAALDYDAKRWLMRATRAI
ncbi:MAG: M24 family metallopeptidase [Rickettsiales bacterium]